METSNETASGILIAEDDDEDYILARKLVAAAIWKRSRRTPLVRVRDGEALMEHLARRLESSGARASPLPRLILLDLSLPKKDGFTALAEIRAQPALRPLPVVILTGSVSPEDRARAARLGAPFLRKALSAEEAARAVSGLGQFWYDVVEAPSYLAAL